MDTFLASDLQDAKQQDPKLVLARAASFMGTISNLSRGGGESFNAIDLSTPQTEHI